MRKINWQQLKRCSSGALIFAVALAIPQAVWAQQRPGPVPFSEVGKGSHSGANTGAENLIIEDDAGWRAALARHRILGSAVKPDFSREVAVGVFMGLRNTGGYSTQITRVFGSASIVSVFYKSKSPAPGSMVTMALTSPYHVIKIKKTNRTIKFVLNNRVFTPKIIPFKIMEAGTQTAYRVRQSQQLTFRDQAQFDRFYSRHKRGQRAPRIDFSRELVSVLLSGEKTSGGYSVATKSVTRTASRQITVVAHETAPRPGSFNTTVMTYPFQIIRYPATVGDSVTYKVKGANSQNPKFTEIVFVRANASARRYEVLTVESTGKAIYELRDGGGSAVLKRHEEKLDAGQLSKISKQVQGSRFYKMSDPSRQPGYSLPPGADIFTLKVEDNPTNTAHKISYNGATARQAAFNVFHTELENLLNKLARGAVAPTLFSTLRLRDVRPQGSGSSFNTTTTTTVNKDGSITRFITAPNIRSIPVTGRVSSSDLKTIQKLTKATDFFAQSFLTPLYSPTTPLTTLTVEAGSRKKGVTHPSSTLGGARGRDVLALESFLRSAQIIQGFKAFDSLTYSTALNGFILDVNTLKIDKTGTASWSQNRNGQLVSNKSGALSPAEIAEVKRLYGATDFMNQRFRPFYPSAGARYNNLSASANGTTKTFGHLVGAYNVVKAAELKALEAYLDALLVRGPGASPAFDELNYKVITLATGASEEILIRGDQVQWRKADGAGNSVDKKQLKLSVAELAKLQKLYGAADYFNQPSTFPQLVRRVRSHDYELALKANGQSKTISASIFASEPANFSAFRQELDSILKRFKGPQVLTVTGKVLVRKSLPVQVVISASNKLYRVVGAKEAAVAKLSGRTVKVEGSLDPSGRLNVTAILSPKRVVFTGISSSKGGAVTLVKNNKSHVVLGALKNAVAAFKGKSVSVEALKFANDDLEVEKVFAQASRTTFAIPFTIISKGTRIDIVGQFNRDFSLVTLNGGRRTFYVRTRDLQARKVTTRGMLGAIGSTR
jgi:hypothetical protein